MSKTLAFCVFILFGCNPPGCSPDSAMLMKVPAGSICYTSGVRGGAGMCVNGNDLYTCTIDNVGCGEYEARCVLRARIHEVSTGPVGN